MIKETEKERRTWIWPDNTVRFYVGKTTQRTNGEITSIEFRPEERAPNGMSLSRHPQDSALRTIEEVTRYIGEIVGKYQTRFNDPDIKPKIERLEERTTEEQVYEDISDSEKTEILGALKK